MPIITTLKPDLPDLYNLNIWTLILDQTVVIHIRRRIRIWCLFWVRIAIQPVLFTHCNNPTLRKHAYSNILKISPPKNWKFSDKNSDLFHISAQNIDCRYSLEPPRRGGSNEYPQSMILSRNKKNNVYPFKPQFDYIKVGFKGVKII